MFYPLSFYLCPFLFQDPIRLSHYILLSCLLRLLSPVTVSHTSLVFDDLGLRSTGQLFCRMLLNWGSLFFLIIRLGFRVWEKKTTEKVPFSLHHCKGTIHMILTTVTLLFLSFFHTVCWEIRTYVKPTLKDCAVLFHILEG